MIQDMTDRLICAVDATPESAGAVCAAVAVGQALGMRIVLVHVAEREDGLAGPARSAGADLERSLAGLPVPADAIRRIEVGDPAELVVAAAHDEHAALILAGTRDAGVRGKAVFGSVAARIVELAPTPVIVAPAACRASACAGNPPAPREVIVAVDGTDESRAVAGYVANLARRARTAVVFAHVLPPLSPTLAPPVGIVPPFTEPDRERGWRVLDEARRVAPESGDVELELRRGIPARELEGLARERGSELIALGTSRPGRLRRALSGSLADELAASSHRLVMLVPHDVAQPALAREAVLAAVR
jgi:nucleotide-binding universal stress UspA family protein